MRIASQFPSRLRNHSLIVLTIIASTVCGSTQAHTQSYFVNEVVDSSGIYSSLAVDAQGNPHVSYCRRPSSMPLSST